MPETSCPVLATTVSGLAPIPDSTLDAAGYIFAGIGYVVVVTPAAVFATQPGLPHVESESGSGDNFFSIFLQRNCWPTPLAGDWLHYVGYFSHECLMMPWLWGAASLTLVTIAQLLMKWGMTHLPLSLPGDIWMLVFIYPLAILAVFFGLVCYGLSMFCWLFLLRHLPLNRAYPVLSLSYILVYLLALWLPWFNEAASLLKTSGVVLILFGVWLTCSEIHNKSDSGKVR